MHYTLATEAVERHPRYGRTVRSSNCIVIVHQRDKNLAGVFSGLVALRRKSTIDLDDGACRQPEKNR